MAPGCLARRLNPATSILFVWCVLFVLKTVRSLLVYDRQQLLNIKGTVDLTVNYSQGGSKTFPPPFLADVPVHLICTEGPPPRRRRGTRRGWLARMKARLALSLVVALLQLEAGWYLVRESAWLAYLRDSSSKSRWKEQPKPLAAVSVNSCG